MKLLYITWDAPRVPYLESLFIPVLVGLKSRGITTDIFQFRWGDEKDRSRIAKICRSEQLGYRSKRVWRCPSNFLGTMLTIMSSGAAIRRAVRQSQPDIILARSPFAGIATHLAGGARLAPLVYDPDGLELDGRVETGNLSASGLPYRLLRALEMQLTRSSRQVLARTKFGAGVMLERAGPGMRPDQFHVVTNGRDPVLFHRSTAAERANVRSELGFGADDPVLIYAGALTEHYRIPEVARFARAVRARVPSTKLLVLTGNPDDARERLAEGDANIAREATIFRAAPADVPHYLSIGDVGFSSFDDLMVSRAGAPIKLAEYLLCGVPVVGTLAVGDTGAAHAAGVFFDDRLGPEAAAKWVVEDVLPNRERFASDARRVGEANFSLQKSVDEYTRALTLALQSEPIRQKSPR